MKSGEVGWERGEQACLVSAAVSCIAKPLSSICTSIRGKKSPVFNKAWDESCGEISMTGVNPLMCMLIPQLMSVNFCLLLLFFCW